MDVMVSVDPTWHAHAELTRELDSGEKLIWWGQPAPGVMFVRSLVGSLLGVVWLLISLVAFLAAKNSGQSPLILAVLSLFVLFGIVGVGSAPVAWLDAIYTVYGVTDCRLLRLRTAFGRRRVTSWTRFDINGIERRDCFGGQGDVVFRRMQRNTGESVEVVEAGFYAILNSAHVETLIRRFAVG